MRPAPRQLPHVSLLLLVLGLWPLAAVAAPPRVVKATPDNGDENVNPSTREIRVEFDQAMTTGQNYSFVGGGDNFPKTTGKPRWLNDRTIVLPVQLKPNHEYWLSINNQSFQNFRSKQGEPAEGYPIAFKTGPLGAGSAPARPLTPEMNRDAIAAMRQAVDRSYSHRDLHKLDWDALFKQATPKLEAAKNAKQFATEAAKMLGRNEDMHLWLKVGPATIPTFTRKVQPNYSRALLTKTVPGLAEKSNAVCTGRFPDGIGYVLIRSWPGDAKEQLDAAFSQLGEAGLKAMIVDVRPNGGGAEPLAQEYAGCYVDKAKVYAKHVIREEGEFGPVRERSFGPKSERPAFRGRVAVLSGRSVMSSCESFLLMMKQVPNCTIIGERSYGSSGNPQPVDLGNGVTLFVPCWRDLRPDGTCIEREGIAPDIEIKTEPGDFAQSDPVLETALRWLRQRPANAGAAK